MVYDGSCDLPTTMASCARKPAAFCAATGGFSEPYLTCSLPRSKGVPSCSTLITTRNSQGFQTHKACPRYPIMQAEKTCCTHPLKCTLRDFGWELRDWDELDPDCHANLESFAQVVSTARPVTVYHVDRLNPIRDQARIVEPHTP